MDYRTVFHIDMDAFFASIEIARNPNLVGKAVIVGGQPNTRGVVSTCSYEARQFGVHSAMSLTEAYRRCPHGVFLDGNFAIYRQYSRAIMEIFRRFTPNVEVVSVDEAYLDVTEIVKKFSTPEALGQEIKKAVFDHTQLTCSIGIASNKLIAKIASSKNKPNGLFRIVGGDEAKFLSPMPIEAIPGIGPKTQIQLNHEGIKFISDLQSMSMEELLERYGASGYFYYLSSRGIDDRPVEEDDSPPKSINMDTTFEKDMHDIRYFKMILSELVEKVCSKLRRYKMRAFGVSLKLRFNDFKTITRSKALFSQTNKEEEILKAILLLFEHNYSERNLPLRMIGISVEKLNAGYWQPTFWD
jgi:DNA polymerase IV